MLYEFFTNHKKLFLMSVVIVVALIVVLIYAGTVNTGKEQVKIYLIPSDANLVLNGDTLKPGTKYLDPGTYSFTVDKAGFKKYEGSITVGKSDTNTIDVALEPESADALAWVKDNSSAYSGYEDRVGIQAVEHGQIFTDMNPITGNLPIHNVAYTIGYRADTSDPSGNSIILTIDASSVYRKSAIDKIRNLGYDPTNFKIEFKNYRNPFDE